MRHDPSGQGGSREDNLFPCLALTWPDAGASRQNDRPRPITDETSPSTTLSRPSSIEVNGGEVHE